MKAVVAVRFVTYALIWLVRATFVRLLDCCLSLLRTPSRPCLSTACWLPMSASVMSNSAAVMESCEYPTYLAKSMLPQQGLHSMQSELGASYTEAYSILKAHSFWGPSVCLAIASEWLAIHPHHDSRANSMEDEVDTSTLQIFHGNVESGSIKTSGCGRNICYPTLMACGVGT